MQTESSSSSLAANNGSGSGLPRLTVTLPPLKSLSKSLSKKQRGKLPLYAEPVQKPPRPVKLKPLKEVLSKLITQIKKKDDYAFFLQPVDVSLVPGYTDVISSPMDFGTITNKIEKGKYRSLEDFKNDFLLVTTNARTFNPPSSVFFSEAARIEAWGLDHISKSSAHVIEYETDWNIDVVEDAEPTPSMDDIEPASAVTMKMDIDEPLASARSPSVVSTPQGQTFPPEKSRKSRSKKHPIIVTESFEPEGHLPGAKDGLGAFPPGSDLAALMLALKLRRRRVRSKKERLRLEKGGPPFAADGSLDYLEMDDPFTVLQLLTPDPPENPELLPVLPQPKHTLSVIADTNTQEQPTVSTDQALNAINLPVPIAIPLEELPSILFVSGDTASDTSKSLKRKHWRVERTGPNRNRGRDVEESNLGGPKRPRKDDHTDYGTFSYLVGSVASSLRLHAREVVDVLGTEENLFEAIRHSIENRQNALQQSHVDKPSINGTSNNGDTLTALALEAEQYLIDVVYGGVDGLAYVRSLAEFVGESDLYKNEVAKAEEPENYENRPTLMLSQWVKQYIVDPLTAGRHAVLRGLARSGVSSNELPSDIEWLKSANTDFTAHLETLSQLINPQEQIDLAALIHAPHELFLAESEWAGASYKAAKVKEQEDMEDFIAASSAAEYLALAIERHHKAELGTDSGDKTQITSSDTVEVIQHALGVGAETILEADRRLRDSEATRLQEDGLKDEDPLLKRLRLNLLAVAKRAPLDRIARLPAELVPAHIRDLIPTLSS